MDLKLAEEEIYKKKKLIINIILDEKISILIF